MMRVISVASGIFAAFAFMGGTLVFIGSAAQAKCHGNIFKCPGKNIPHPHINAGGGGGGGGRGQSRPAPSTRLEEDPTHQSVGCHTPYRAVNLTDRDITVFLNETFRQEGPNCNVVGETKRLELHLGPREGRYLGCSLLASTSSTCVDIRKWTFAN